MLYGNLLILKIIHYLSEIEIYIYPSFLYLKNQGTLGKAKILRSGLLGSALAFHLKMNQVFHLRTGSKPPSTLLKCCEDNFN